MTDDNDIKQGAPVDPVRRSFRKALVTALKRSERKADKLYAEIEETKKAEQLLECGEIIKANLAEIPRGTAEISLPDPYHPGQSRSIELDPQLKPMGNAKRYFKRYRKLIDGMEKRKEELELCQAEGAKLRDLLGKFDKWQESAANTDQIPENITNDGKRLRVHVEGVEEKGKSTPNKEQQISGIRTFESRDGMEILVGKNSRDNDHLSLRIAKGNDWWLHVAHYTGSHVVIRMSPANSRQKVADKKRKKDSQACPPETLLDAAHLALYFSKARNATKAEVHYTQAKHVRKRKGAPAGQVTLGECKCLLVRIEESRLDRLLKGNREELLDE